MNTQLLHRLSIAQLFALIALCVLWETVLAPLQPGSWKLALKCIPLLFLVAPMLRQDRRAYQRASLMVWLYFAEGMVRATSDRGASVPYAWAEAALSVGLFLSVAYYCKGTRKPQVKAV
jgi:uncharacterized membrane protein